MNRNAPPPNDPWESDAVWKLLDQAPPVTAGPRFADDVLRAARLEDASVSWWKRLLTPAPLAGLAATTAALAFAFVALVSPGSRPASPQIAFNQAALEQTFADIQEVAEAEALIAAADHLDDFSDHELVSLIGF